MSTSTLFMIFRGTYTICEGPELDAWRSQSAIYANCRYDTMHQHKKIFEVKQCLHFDI